MGLEGDCQPTDCLGIFVASGCETLDNGSSLNEYVGYTCLGGAFSPWLCNCSLEGLQQECNYEIHRTDIICNVTLTLDVRFRVIISMDAFERRRLNWKKKELSVFGNHKYVRTCKVNEDRIELWLQERLVRSTSLTGLKWVSGRLQLDQMVQEVLRDKAG